MSATITNAAATLADGNMANLTEALVADLAHHGVPADDQRFATPDEYRIGDLVAIHAHQRTRVARVWKVGRTKVSAVYVTPSEVVAAGKVGRPVWPNNITGVPIGLVSVGLVVGLSVPAEVAAPVAGGPAVPVATAPAYHCGMLPIGADLEGALF